MAKVSWSSGSYSMLAKNNVGMNKNINMIMMNFFFIGVPPKLKFNVIIFNIVDY